MDHLPNSKIDINTIYQISRGNDTNIFSRKIFSSSGKLALCSDEQKNIRKNYINVAKAEYNWKENQADRKDIQILGETFTKNNKRKCKVIYNNKYYKLTKYLSSNDIIQKNKNILKIKYKNISINNMTEMFRECKLLINIFFFKWNTNNVFDMSYLFDRCESLETIKGLDNFNTSNVTNMEYMFYGCNSLINISNLEKWDIRKVEDISYMFYSLEKMKSLPNISKWEIDNVKNMEGLFYSCSSIKLLPDISNWNTKNVVNMKDLFYDNSNLISFPDISKWNTESVTNMSGLFSYSSFQVELSYISNWNTKNVTDMSGIFGFYLKDRLPDISKWDIRNVTNISFMFSD